MIMPEYLNGLKVVTNEMLVDGYLNIPKRKNKNKRIQKKWNKKYGYKVIPIPMKQVFVFNNQIIGHPIIIQKMYNKIKEGELK